MLADELDQLRKCRDCGHVFQSPPDVTISYDAAYIRKYDRYPTLEISYLRLGFLKAFCTEGRLLDVGYGKGDFLRLARAAGFQTYGCDVHGVSAGVEEIDLEQDSSLWDVVTMFDSLEHFPSFELLRRLFRRSDRVMVSVPWPPHTFPADRRWKHYKPGEHGISSTCD
jgi:hypothetical protein